jgi:hypothetical protein
MRERARKREKERERERKRERQTWIPGVPFVSPGLPL